MSNPNRGGNAHPHPRTIAISSDTEDSDFHEGIDSDSEDGGMQLDPPDPTLQLQIASREMELDMAQENDGPPQRQGKPITPTSKHPTSPADIKDSS